MAAVLLSISALFPAVVLAETRSAGFTVDLPSGIEKSVRLKKLPRGTNLSIRILCDREVWTSFMDLRNYALRKSDACRPLFTGQVKKRLNFAITIPKTGDYFIVFKSAATESSQTVEVKIDATQSRALADQLDRANAILSRFENGLHKLFVFDEFEFAIERCNQQTDFSDSTGVVVCIEYLESLQQSFTDREMAQNALAISLFLKIGRELADSWGLAPPQSQKEPQLSLVLMIMLNLSDKIQSFCEAIVADPSPVRRLARKLGTHRTPFSKKQAQRYLDWMGDPEFARKWQKTLVPHMQTRFLKRLSHRPRSWTDLDAVKAELGRRTGSII